MEKFSRTYFIKFSIGEYSIESNSINISDEVYASYPLTTEFAIGRSISSLSNTARVVIYGLDETKRRLLYKDRDDWTKYVRMEIYAGYGEANSLIYRGAVQECYSFRNGGETEYKTFVDSSDAAMDYFLGKASVSLNKGSDIQTDFNQLGSKLIDLSFGVVSPYIQFPTRERGVDYTGKPLRILREISTVKTEDGKNETQTMSSDLGVINFIRQNYDVIQNFGILEIDCTTGLLGTPKRKNTLLSVDLIFEPAARLNQLAILNSQTSPFLNSGFKIMGVSHNGIMSGAKCGSMITTLDLFIGVGAFKNV